MNQCFGSFTMLPVQGSSQTGAFRDLSKHVFRGRLFWKYIRCEGRLFLKMFKFNADSKNAQIKWDEIFCFWDKFMWIVCIYLSLLIREYLSSAVNLLRKDLKNFHVSKSDFCNSVTSTLITQDDKGAVIKIESAFRPVYHVACQEVLSNETFSTFI